MIWDATPSNIVGSGKYNKVGIPEPKTVVILTIPVVTGILSGYKHSKVK